MSKEHNRRQNKEKSQIWLWVCTSILAILVMVQFVQSQLYSNNPKSEISKVETKQEEEPSQLKSQVRSLTNEVDRIKDTLNHTQNNYSTLSNKVSEIERKFEELENKDNSSSPEIDNAKSSDWEFWLAFGLSWTVLIVLFIIYRKMIFRPTEWNREMIIKTVLESQRIEEKFNSKTELYKLTHEIKSIEDKITSLEKQIKDLQNKQNSGEDKTNAEENESNPQLRTNDIKFFKSRNGKTLTQELPNSTDAFFKIFNIKDNEAEFEYCGGVINQDFLSEVCIFENNPSDVLNKTRIITVAPGSVKKDANNNWEVTGKTKIKFE